MVFSSEVCYQEQEVTSGETIEVDSSMISFGIMLGILGWACHPIQGDALPTRRAPRHYVAPRAANPPAGRLRHVHV